MRKIEGYKEAQTYSDQERLPVGGYILGIKNVEYKENDWGDVIILSFDIEEGEFLSILGPSGSGKSTLMNIIGCLDTPTSGEYILHGRTIRDLDEKQLAHIRSKEIGFIFQQFTHGFAEFAQYGFVRYGRKILLNQLSSISAENFREVQRIEQRKNEVLTAESFRETFLRGGRAVHGKHGAAVLPDTVNSMRLAFIGAQYSFHPHHGRAAVVQPV